ncbi:MAG: DUF2318 domain-containing protein [Desulfovibrio sp.]|jgi:uncharacterized membrane protein|nr:DUF2318 domain-containing protein [Desulfovibrio sp.]
MRRIFLTLFIFALLPASLAQAFFGLFDSSPENARAKDGVVTLDVSGISPANARNYIYREGQNSIKFFLVRDSGGVVRAALDACDVCWKEGRGYQPKDGAMVCLNCGQRFPLSRIGIIKGGCNPHPLKFDLKDNTVSIESSELLSGAQFFPGKTR